MGQKRWVILSVVVLLSFVLPAGLCLALALAPAPSLAALAVLALAAAAWLGLFVLVNWWEFTSLWLRWAWLGVLAAVVVWRVPTVSGGGLALDGLTVCAAIFAVAGAWLVAKAMAARRHPGDAIELSFPLKGGRFLVTDGGDGARSFLVNYHYGFGRHRASGVSRSMRYAMDVVEVGPALSEATGFLPRENEAYRIWQKTLHAPCDGRVVHVVNDVADNTAFGADRPYGVGNHVVISTGGDAYIVLGHAHCGSLTVSPGDTVRAGDAVGRVGNSGWTERPHLHMQAMRSATGEWWQGEPLAMRFKGRFLVRNQLLRA